MATNGSRSADRRAASTRAAGQWLLGLLIVLALIASCLMIWSKQLSVPASIAVIAALWAAVLGAIGITRFRRQAEVAEARSRDMRLVYELQLEREIAARRQYEMDIEAQIRSEVAAEANHELQELQAQIASLRASLESMMGHPLPEERVALPNERLRELASSMPTYEPDDSVLAATDFASTAPPAGEGRHVPPPEGGQADWTEIIPVVEDAREQPPSYTAQWDDAQGYSAGDYSVTTNPRGTDDSDDSPTESWVTPSRQSDVLGDFDAPQRPEPRSGGRRRGDGHGKRDTGISAAELLDQLRREDG
ncbi:DUF6779 domain-containing protein [Gordonia sp. (in: high G+C Gram-positive bacteria)]|uniref:DUF6779 domain-containing protein n=1 Tax=Gordonia sp. (in: high G+C Gram-positive bacteria) TaxID=84139 RepID=UPI0039E21C91